MPGLHLVLSRGVGVLVVSVHLHDERGGLVGWGPCPLADFYEIHGYALFPAEAGTFSAEEGLVADADFHLGHDCGGAAVVGGLCDWVLGFCLLWLFGPIGVGFLEDGVDFSEGFGGVGEV